MKKIAILLISLALLLTSTPVPAQEVDGFMVVMDIVLARPFGLASLVIGGAFFVVALPFAATSGDIDNTADVLIGEPFRFTFKRPPGNFFWIGTYDKGQQIEELQPRGVDASGEEKEEPQNSDTSQ